MNKTLRPDAIVGNVIVTVSLTCQRCVDKQRGLEPKIYTFFLGAEHIGSASLVNSLPAEMDRLINDAVRTVRRWEYRAKMARDKSAEVHRRPGTEEPASPTVVAEILPQGQAHRRPGT